MQSMLFKILKPHRKIVILRVKLCHWLIKVSKQVQTYKSI